ncbi:hypothetical protein PPL_08095 [Heterostelium album PN500]|uniref:Uncharacterized protein n=1 Tax=Heterostelium pallidum (strain ATCC 26659 / Pp 5 / PN500) TaxID=670386 RepID=D3BIL6_HETP5|nr:hypothetical protein PPL_08095 [Heterostelium album PN500]EFA78640.1 hypothetical protein PPL_08095 [Heterostelium album PN500]|eukprot:XP_020430764.1 hypothetical protein PPL_08095 [Heterostelium album PN500]
MVGVANAGTCIEGYREGYYSQFSYYKDSAFITYKCVGFSTTDDSGQSVCSQCLRTISTLGIILIVIGVILIMLLLMIALKRQHAKSANERIAQLNAQLNNRRSNDNNRNEIPMSPIRRPPTTSNNNNNNNNTNNNNNNNQLNSDFVQIPQINEPSPQIVIELTKATDEID